MLGKVNSLLADRSALAMCAIAVVFLAIVATIDHFSGYEISFSVFYLIPTSIVAWYVNRRLGYAMSLLSAITWMIAETTTGQSYTEDWILLWNTLVRLAFFTVVAYLLTELKSQLHSHRTLARTDNLTGLLNRGGFFERAKSVVDVASRYGNVIAVAYIDLNGFKVINDGMGHAEGDKALRTIGRLLDESSRTSDIVARFGGDEFVILLPNTTLQGASAYFQKLQTEMQRLFQEHGWASLGSSVGAVVFESAPHDIDEALRRADVLMYRVKQSGQTGLIVEEASAMSFDATNGKVIRRQAF